MNTIKNFIVELWVNKIKRHQLILVLLAVSLIVILKNRFDYNDYVQKWQFFLDNIKVGNYGTNAYGPLHNFMAFFYYIHPKFPRLIFSICALLSSFYLFNRINKNPEIDASTKKRLTYLILYNPLIWIFFVVNGCNDGLVACLFLFGIVLYDKNKFMLSAFLLSLAILYKYIPLFIIPILCINNKRINWNFSLSTLFFLGAGFGATYLTWGSKFLEPILFNSGRESKILSIFRHFRSDYSILQIFGIGNIDYLSTYLVVGSVIIVFIIHVLYNLNYFYSLILTLLFIFLFYKVGHFQFYMSIYLLLVYFISRNARMLKVQLKLNKNIYLFLYWIAGTTLLYGITEGFYKRFHIIREFIGIPHFVVLAVLIGSLLVFLARRVNNRTNQSDTIEVD